MDYVYTSGRHTNGGSESTGVKPVTAISLTALDNARIGR